MEKRELTVYCVEQRTRFTMEKQELTVYRGRAAHAFHNGEPRVDSLFLVTPKRCTPPGPWRTFWGTTFTDYRLWVVFAQLIGGAAAGAEALPSACIASMPLACSARAGSHAA